MNSYLSKVIKEVREKNRYEKEFLQASMKLAYEEEAEKYEAIFGGNGR